MDKTYKYIISIPVHEKPEVVIDLICNIKKYAEEAAIILHISKGFNWNSFYMKKETFFEKLLKMDNVYINPEQFDTKWGGIIHTHIANFKYICSQVDFEYFILMASNELFVSNKLDEWIGDNDIGVRTYQDMDTNDWSFEGNARNDNCLQSICKEVGTEKVFICRPEGQFYKKEVFNEIVEVISKHYDVNREENNVYPREEVYIPTVGIAIADKMKVKEEIFNVMDNTAASLDNAIINVLKTKRLSIKPIERELYNSNRIYLRQDYKGGYFDLVQEYFSNITRINHE